MRIFDRSNADYLLRKRILSLVVYGSAVIFVIYLIQLQIINHQYFESKVVENSIKTLYLNPLRGIFYDRNFEKIVDNRIAYSIVIIPTEYDKKNNEILEKVLGLQSGYIDKIIAENSKQPKHLPIRIKRDVDYALAVWIEENNSFLKGVKLQTENQRLFRKDVAMSHIIGYMREISKSQYEAEKEFYNLGDFVGHVGIERFYEKILRGKKGVSFVIVDATRKEVGLYNDGANDIQAIKGADLILTIDIETQKAAERAFEGKRGALVAIDPKTGEIIAMVSSPWFDLDAVSSVTFKEVWNSIVNDPQKPLFNRATMSPNPPGSTFKILASIAALEEGVIDENTTIFCGGAFKFGDKVFKCHGAHGSINVVKAIEKSCNVFYYQLIFKIGFDRWTAYGRKFGFGSKTNIDLFEEISGIMPSREYFNKRYGPRGWTDGFLVSLGIGQGEVNVTQIQLAQFVSLVANNGKTRRPHLVKGYINPLTGEYKEINYPEINVEISQKTFDIVKKGMFLVVNGYGTAGRIRHPEIKIAGKTGTSQNPHGEDHALFIAFAPFEDPKIAVSVLVENVGYGATHAAPIAREVILTYLNQLSKNKETKNYNIAMSNF